MQGSTKKWSEKQAAQWDEALGPLLDTLPSAQICMVLQCYRVSRIEYLILVRGDLSILQTSLQKKKKLWDISGVPTVSEKACALQIVNAVELWNHQVEAPDGRLDQSFQMKLDD